jgi:hypothetical protein
MLCVTISGEVDLSSVHLLAGKGSPTRYGRAVPPRSRRASPAAVRGSRHARAGMGGVARSLAVGASTSARRLVVP